MKLIDLAWGDGDKGFYLKAFVNREQGLTALKSFDVTKETDLVIALTKNKRSLDANSFMWVICDKIAKVIRSTKEDVYRVAIKDVGEWEDKPILSENVEKHIKMWSMIGDGWFSEDRRDSKLDGYRIVRDYYGSHIYDSVSMSRLIDYLVDEAEELEINIMTPDEIERLKSSWGKEK